MRENQVLVWLVYKKTCSPVQRNPSFTHTFTHTCSHQKLPLNLFSTVLIFFIYKVLNKIEKRIRRKSLTITCLFFMFYKFLKVLSQTTTKWCKRNGTFRMRRWQVDREIVSEAFWTSDLPMNSVCVPVQTLRHTPQSIFNLLWQKLLARPWWFSDFQITAWEGEHTFGLKQQCLWVGGVKLTSETKCSHWSCAFSGFGLWWWKIP